MGRGKGEDVGWKGGRGRMQEGRKEGRKLRKVKGRTVEVKRSEGKDG